MKFSKVLHVVSILVGFSGIVTVLAAVNAGAEALVWGLSREHLLFCSIILFLVAIWTQIATIHHMMLEKKGEMI